MNLFFQRGKGVRKFLEVDTSTYFLKPRMFPSVGSGPLAPPQPSPMPYVFVTTDRCVENETIFKGRAKRNITHNPTIVKKPTLIRGYLSFQYFGKSWFSLKFPLLQQLSLINKVLVAPSGSCPRPLTRLSVCLCQLLHADVGTVLDKTIFPLSR